MFVISICVCLSLCLSLRLGSDIFVSVFLILFFFFLRNSVYRLWPSVDPLVHRSITQESKNRRTSVLHDHWQGLDAPAHLSLSLLSISSSTTRSSLLPLKPRLKRKQSTIYLYHERGKRRSVSLPNILCVVRRTDLLPSMQLAFICSITKSWDSLVEFRWYHFSGRGINRKAFIKKKKNNFFEKEKTLLRLQSKSFYKLL